MTDNQPQPARRLPHIDDSVESIANYERLIDGDSDAATAARALLAEAATLDATEIYLSPETGDGKQRVTARLKIMGDIVLHDSYDRHVGDAVIARFRRAVSTTAAMAAGSGRCDITVPSNDTSAARRCFLRVTHMPSLQGALLAIRLLPRTTERQTLASVFPASDSDIAERIKRSVGKGSGIVLVAGPGGTGKSTTLAAMLGYLATSKRKVLSIEDPVEVLVPGVQQIPLDSTGLDHSRMLKHCMRCDPDVIMLDEFPDHRTVETAVAVSQEGHTLLAGVTIRSASLAVTRLVHMGAEREQLADELRLIVAQRLVKRLCVFCSDDGEPRGCSDCTNGYAGRVAVAETLEFTGDVVGAVHRSFMSESMIKPLNGYRIFEEHAAALIANKVTTHAEIERALGVAISPMLLDRAAEAAGGTAR